MEMTAPVVLSEAEMEHAHRESLLILERAGVRVLDAECRSLLAKAVFPWENVLAMIDEWKQRR